MSNHIPCLYLPQKVNAKDKLHLQAGKGFEKQAGESIQGVCGHVHASFV